MHIISKGVPLAQQIWPSLYLTWQIKIKGTASLRDAFANEIVKLSPPELTLLDLQHSSNLRNFVLSPMASCPKLTDLNLSGCSSLDYVMLQSPTLRTFDVRGCSKATKVSEWEGGQVMNE